MLPFARAGAQPGAESATSSVDRPPGQRHRPGALLQLTWARGELTAVLGIAVLGLLAYVGVIDRPGEPSSQIELAWGWYMAVAGSILMLAGAALRTGRTSGAASRPARSETRRTKRGTT
jgi:hypothetical protein